MFKTDKASLERMSFCLGDRDLSNFKAVLERLKSDNLLTISPEETQRALKGLEDIGKLKLEGKVYAFHVSDSLAEYESGNGEGVELYLRQGNRLEEFYVPPIRDYVYSVSDAIDFLHSKKIHAIFTGSISKGSNFLEVLQECDEDDPLAHSSLRENEIYLFNSHDINVITLDSLI
jgi:hypothetical protein